MKTWPKTFDSDIRAYEAISIVFLDHPNLLYNFFEDNRPRLRQSPDEMLKTSSHYSSGEAILVKVALDIWCGSGNTLVSELTGALDIFNFIKVLNALIHVKSDNLSRVSMLKEPIF